MGLSRPFQTKIFPLQPWSKIKQSVDSSALWENGFSAATNVIDIFPLASDTLVLDFNDQLYIFSVPISVNIYSNKEIKLAGSYLV